MPVRPPDHEASSWDALAPVYDHTILPLTRPFAEDAARLVGAAAGLHMLDVAAGTGAATIAAARAGARVTAIDFSAGMVRLLEERVRRAGIPADAVRVACMDGQALDLPPDTFDGALSVFGLNFFPDRARGISEMWRVLRAEARAVIVSWGRPEDAPFLPVVREAAKRAGIALPAPPPGPAPLYSLQDPVAFAKELEGAGLRDVRVEALRHEWILESPERFWAALEGTPVMATLRSQVGDARLGDLSTAVAGVTRERWGARPRVPLQAWAGLGVK